MGFNGFYFLPFLINCSQEIACRSNEKHLDTLIVITVTQTPLNLDKLKEIPQNCSAKTKRNSILHTRIVFLTPIFLQTFPHAII